MAWEFKDKNKSVFFRGPVQLVMTSLDEMLDAVLDGCAVAYLPYFLVKPALEEKKISKFIGTTRCYLATFLFVLYEPSLNVPCL